MFGPGRKASIVTYLIQNPRFKWESPIRKIQWLWHANELTRMLTGINEWFKRDSDEENSFNNAGWCENFAECKHQATMFTLTSIRFVKLLLPAAVSFQDGVVLRHAQ